MGVGAVRTAVVVLGGAAALVALAAPARALAYAYDTFYGWSSDGSYYARAIAGSDGVAHPSLCLTDPRVPSPTWPKGVAAPDASGCVEVAAAKKWVHSPKAVSAGPHGEIVQVSFADRAAIVTLTLQGKKVGEATVALEKEDAEPGVRQLFWRSDGGAAAVYVGHPPPRHPTAAGQPARHLAMISLIADKSDRGDHGDRGAAEAANSRGMKLYRAKDYAAAAAEFRRAVAADASYVLPHYNLACVAALTGDAATAVAELQWLAASGDPLAKSKLDKARSDPDLRSVIDRPEVKAIVAY